MTDVPNYNIKSRRLKSILAGPPPEPMPLAELERLSKRGGFRIETKGERRKREQLGARLAKAKKAARRRRQREARAGLALLGGKGDHGRAEVAREGWKRRFRPPAGTLENDRLIIAAMWPADWYSARQIHERTDWTRLSPAARPRPSLSWLGVPLTRLERLGVIEKVVRGESYRYRTGAKGRQSTHFFRLTQAGIDLRHAIAAGSVPLWGSMVRVKPRPVCVNPGEQKTLCAMAPGQWWSIGDICRALGLSWRHKSERKAIDNALRRHLVPAGAVAKAQNPDWQGPGREEPRFLYRLTDRGEQAREGLMLLG